MKNIVYLFLLVCFSCDHTEQKDQDDKAEEKTKTHATFTDLTIEDSVLLAAFYGTAQRDTLSVKRDYLSVLTLPLKDLELRPETDSIIIESEAENIKARITDKVYYGEGNNYCACFTSLGIDRYNCHPCGAALGIFILKKNKDDKWDCISHNYDLRLQGAYGYTGITPFIYKISDNDYAVDVSTGFTATGCTMQAEYHFIVLNAEYTQAHIEDDDEENSFYYDDLGLCDSTNGERIGCFEYSSKFNFVKSDSAGAYYDLNVITKGTRLAKTDKQKAIAYDRERIYRWKNNQYVLVNDITKK